MQFTITLEDVHLPRVFATIKAQIATNGNPEPSDRDALDYLRDTIMGGALKAYMRLHEREAVIAQALASYEDVRVAVVEAVPQAWF